MIAADTKTRLESLAQTIMEQQGAELVDVKISGHDQDVLVAVTADKPAGGITIEECARLNKALAQAITSTGILSPEIFSLELSSPGLDRPLVSRKDFLRCLGQEVHLWLSEPVAGKKEVQGILKGVGERDLTIDAGAKAGLTVALPGVIKGQLVI